MATSETRRKPTNPGHDVELADGAPIALIVEDDRDAAMVASGLLRLLGYRSRITFESTEALYALAEGLPSLMLMDVCLPMMDGLGLIKVARRIEGMRTVPVVAVSAIYPEDGAVARGLAAAGVTAYLSKPYTLNGLRASIDEARSAALRLGPAPTPSMGEGLRSISDDDIEGWRGGSREEPEPPPPPTPAPPPRSQERPAPAPAPAVAKLRSPPPSASGRMPALSMVDASLDFPVVDTAENDLPDEGEASPQVMEVYAQATVGRRRLMTVVDSCSRSSMTLRSEDEPMQQKDLVRLEVNHRMAVQDTMEDVLIRLLGNVVAIEDLGTEWKYKLHITAARPADAYDHLIEYFDRFRA